MTAARCGSAPIRPMSQMSLPAWSASSPGLLNGTSLIGTPSDSAIAAAMSGATPTGSPASVRPVTSRKFERLMPARRTPVGASSARALSDMRSVYTPREGSKRMAEVIVDTSSGRVRGRQERGVSVFKGIPYAAPPLGENRFHPPRKVEPWNGVRDALAYGDQAVQDDNVFSLPADLLPIVPLNGVEKISEDCLTLNVWTSGTSGATRPVLFWCHGGAFLVGSGSSSWYDGTNLCRLDDVVVVTFNHRLGALGYLHLADIAPETAHDFEGAGTAGMRDIVAALEWVRDNIARFGGDPGNVTIFGESGGGAKVSVLLALPAAKGLFHKAVIQSGPAVQMATREDGTKTALQVLAELGLDEKEVAKLRALPVEKILAAQGVVQARAASGPIAKRRRRGFNPVIDDTYFPGGPFNPDAPAVSAH